jgi:hypothetical protein
MFEHNRLIFHTGNWRIEMRQKVDINEAARISGMSVSWWRQRVYSKQVPFYRVGRRIVFDAQEVERVLERCRVEPAKDGKGK